LIEPVGNGDYDMREKRHIAINFLAMVSLLEEKIRRCNDHHPSFNIIEKGFVHWNYQDRFH